MNEILSQEYGVLASWVAVFIGLLTIAWNILHYCSTNKNLQVNVKSGIPYPTGSLPFNFHICNPGKNKIRIEYVEFTVYGRSTCSVLSEIDLFNVKNPMLTENDILKFSVDGKEIVNGLKRLSCKNKKSFISTLYPKGLSVFIVSSIGKKYKASVDATVKNTIMKAIDCHGNNDSIL